MSKWVWPWLHDCVWVCMWVSYTLATVTAGSAGLLQFVLRLRALSVCRIGIRRDGVITLRRHRGKGHSWTERGTHQKCSEGNSVMSKRICETEVSLCVSTSPEGAFLCFSTVGAGGVQAALLLTRVWVTLLGTLLFLRGGRFLWKLSAAQQCHPLQEEKQWKPRTYPWSQFNSTALLWSNCKIKRNNRCSKYG